MIQIAHTASIVGVKYHLILFVPGHCVIIYVYMNVLIWLHINYYHVNKNVHGDKEINHDDKMRWTNAKSVNRYHSDPINSKC